MTLKTFRAFARFLQRILRPGHFFANETHAMKLDPCRETAHGHLMSGFRNLADFTVSGDFLVDLATSMGNMTYNFFGRDIDAAREFIGKGGMPDDSCFVS